MSTTARWISAIVAGLIIALGAGVVLGTRFNKLEQADAELEKVRTAQARCKQYWDTRSGLSDAIYEFQHGRIGLLSVSEGLEDVENTIVPGLIPKRKAELRKDFTLSGPTLSDLNSDYRRWPRWANCIPYAYASDYNIEMLRLLDRPGDIQFRDVSPELRRRDAPAADGKTV